MSTTYRGKDYAELWLELSILVRHLPGKVPHSNACAIRSRAKW